MKKTRVFAWVFAIALSLACGGYAFWAATDNLIGRANLASGNGKVDNQAGTNSSNSDSPLSDSLAGGDNEQVVVTPEGMVMPVETVLVLNDYGFYHNATLNCYDEHTGVDFAAEVGAQVLAVEAGVVESIYKDDLNSGTEIVVSHDDSLKSVYRFVTEIEGLKVGDEVRKGEVIATVAEANGNEYKDGAHLHFEVLKNGVCVDPATYLALEKK